MFEIVTTLLMEDGIVTGQVPASRIYPYRAAQKITPPYVVINRPGRRDENMLGGDGGYPEIRFRVECCAGTATKAEAIGDAVFDCLVATVKAVVAGYVDVDVWSADLDMTEFDFDSDIYIRTLDFYMRFRAEP